MGPLHLGPWLDNTDGSVKRERDNSFVHSLLPNMIQVSIVQQYHLKKLIGHDHLTKDFLKVLLKLKDDILVYFKRDC